MVRGLTSTFKNKDEMLKKWTHVLGNDKISEHMVHFPGQNCFFIRSENCYETEITATDGLC